MCENTALVAAVTAMARAKGCTAAQISIAWLLAQGSDVVPLVGTKTVTRLAENAAAVAVSLAAEELAALSALPRLKARACSPLALQRLLCCRAVALFIRRFGGLTGNPRQGLRYPVDLHAASYNARMPSIDHL
jgi:hypothetical protein